MATKEQVIDSIRRCYDPEIPVNVYDLGLIYDVDVKQDAANVTMSLTSQSCPSAQQLPDMIKSRIQSECGLENVNVRVVWDPPWTPERISPEGKKILHLE